MSKLQDDIFKILACDMGPAAGPFLERQCNAHLKKKPDVLSKADLPELAKWVEISAGLVLSKEVGAKLAAKVRAL